MNTTENNKLIAEFMNCENSQAWEDDLYIKDWNWSMDVVEKIDSFQAARVGCGVSIYQNMVTIRYNSDDAKFETIKYGNKIEAVYNAVVEFIKWYNLQIK